jgi:hypothetical protein
MRKVQTVVLAILFLALMSVGGNGDEPKKVSNLMRRKLESSQKVLEGWPRNPKLIIKHAEELIEISKQAEWKAIKTARYELHSNDFRRTAETLVQNAGDKNRTGRPHLCRADPVVFWCHNIREGVDAAAMVRSAELAAPQSEVQRRL